MRQWHVIVGLLGAAFILIPVTIVLMVAGMFWPGSMPDGRIIFLTGGLFWILIGSACLVRVAPHIVWGRPATGRVVEVKTREDADVGTTYAPVVRYTIDGTEHEFTAAMSGSYKYTVGKAVRVSYLPHRPGDGWIRSWEHLYLWPVICFGLGGVCVGIWAFAV